MISDLSAIIFIVVIALVLAFVIWSVQSPKHRYLLHRLYLLLLLVYAVWALVMLGMWMTPPDRQQILFLLDAISYIGSSIPSIYLLISIVFVRGYDKLPKKYLLLLALPALTILISLTNPYHHLQYQVFSLLRREIVFGPYAYINGAYSYACSLASFVLMIGFARRNPSPLYIKQCVMVVLGGLCPMLASLIATLSGLDAPITLTPLSFLPTLLFNGIAIYRLNLLDITPVATQHVLDWISDCYLVLSDKGLVLDYNQPFAAVFASRYGITQNRYLKDCVKEEDISKKTAIYNMMTAVEACRESRSTISYEQSATVSKGQVTQKFYYVTDVTQLVVNDKPVGFAVIFKDITQLKKSMQQLQESQTRMMEQERFAFLGQMIGGLAHNLKTPIMSISGCVAAAESLLEECEQSLDDPQVDRDDYREIYGEIRDWSGKIQEATAYMSDIITAIKDQATSVSTFEMSAFTLDELIKRTTLLMRHELTSGGCTLVSSYQGHQDLTLHGDINNMVQVLGNLVSNAIYAQKQTGGGCIIVGLEQEEDCIKLYVKDQGPGIAPEVLKRLFKEMVTNKGTMGSGLGLYISNAVVHAKFGGTMWAENDPAGGAVVGLTIPLPAGENAGGGALKAAKEGTADAEL